MNQKFSNWYAIHTRSHFEQKVYDGLRGKSIETFLPRVQVMSKRKDRRKKLLVPLLPGYVFVRTDLHPEEHLLILKTPGLVRLIGVHGNPIPANEKEIDALMILNGTDRTVENRSYIRKGDQVMIMDGPLKGLIGYYIRHKNKNDKVIVSVELLQRSLEVEIENWALEKISE